MEKKLTKIAKGNVLVSEPFMMDHYLGRSVILIADMDETGAVGFVLNKMTDLSLNECLADWPVFHVPAFFGGPVKTDVVHFLHKFRLDGDQEIMPGVYWGGNVEALRLLVETNQVKPSDIRFFAGYCGWDNRGLEKELKKKEWYMMRGKKEFVYDNHPDEMWGKCMKMMGSNFHVLANFPEIPSLN